ncbi:MAG TPA: branched-chain amino acid ABC transporter permease [Chitinivibrionales bacterium]|nr:branched-chain amino acid ABC transporter permease [Chitinivibrionales bacterium]
MSSYLLQQLINGVQLGTIYALIALGYTLIYGVIKLINFAHADIFMVGAYIAFFLVSFYAGMAAFPPQVCVLMAVATAYLTMVALFDRIPVRKLFPKAHAPGASRRTKLVFQGTIAVLKLLVLAALSAAFAPLLYLGSRFLFSLKLGPFFFPLLAAYVMVMCAVLGVTMERIAYRPLRSKRRLLALITALGVSYFLENFCSLPIVFDNKYRAFPDIIGKFDLVRIPGLDVAVTNLFALNMAVCAVLLFALWFLVEKTLMGKQMRAVAYNHDVASLMGIDVNRIISITFAIGPALAGVSGILYAMNYGVLQSPFLGFFPGMKAFIAAVLGGIGSLPGAVIGAFIMGISEVFANSVDSNLGFAAAFIILIIILLVKPTGILGRSEQEKV